MRPTSHSNERPNSLINIVNLTRQTELARNAEVADHGAARNKGLLGRDSLLPGSGLWIVPCEGVHTFFMKFPIDLVYIDRNKKVRKVRSNVGPWRLSACLSAHSIIELPAGVIQSSKTVAGDQLQFSPVAPVSNGAS
jgi:uncharacterized protein